MSFVQQRKYIDCWSTLFVLRLFFDILYAHMADIRFLTKWAVDPKYCLLFVDSFSSKIYT